MEYSPGHMWYYVSDNPVLYPKDILANVRESGYEGYRKEAIDKIDRKPEPHRSATLRQLRDTYYKDYRESLSHYRVLARKLHAYRRAYKAYRKHRPNDEVQLRPQHLHMNISFVHNHIYNAFGHMEYIDKLLSKQPDLFL